PPTIKHRSSDGEMFEVDVEIAKQSVTIKTMLEDLGMQGPRLGTWRINSTNIREPKTT
uniref:SKP1 component POZ domain-containing protein n=1 Tax=Castor canadensis TaxID=51338 RepID=A0A8C0XL08_CASCN